MRHHPILGLLPLLLSGTVLVACGGSTATTTNAAGSPSGATTAASSPAPAGSTPESPSAASADDFCMAVAEQKQALTTNTLPTLLQSGTAAAWKAYLDQTGAMNDALDAAAPDEIKGAVDELRKGNTAVRQALTDAGFDVRKLKATTIIAVLSSAQHKQASADLVAYVKSHCSIDLSKA